jgi:rhodanese-related sulfurtransferase
MKQMSVQDLEKKLAQGKVAVLDVRTGLEYRAGHIPGAHHVSLGSVGRDPLTLEAPMIAVVCESGHRSAMATQVLEQKGIPAVNVTGGTAAWRAAGLPLERPERTPLSIDRQTHLVAGLMLIAALTLATKVGPSWIWLAALPAFGLMLDALTGLCPMRAILGAMPWNKNRAVCHR